MGLRTRLWLMLGGRKAAPRDLSGEPVEAGLVQLAISEVCVARLKDSGLHPNVVPDTYGKNPRGAMARIFVPADELVDARALIEAFI